MAVYSRKPCAPFAVTRLRSKAMPVVPSVVKTPAPPLRRIVLSVTTVDAALIHRPMVVLPSNRLRLTVEVDRSPMAAPSDVLFVKLLSVRTTLVGGSVTLMPPVPLPSTRSRVRV